MRTLKVLGVFASTLSSVLAMENTSENTQALDTNLTQCEDTVLTPPNAMCGVISGVGILVKEWISIPLTGNNTYGGQSVISRGTLRVEEQHK